MALTGLDYFFVQGNAESSGGLPVVYPDDSFHGGATLTSAGVGETSAAPAGTGKVILTPAADCRIRMGTSPTDPTSSTGIPLKANVQYTFGMGADWTIKAIDG